MWRGGRGRTAWSRGAAAVGSASINLLAVGRSGVDGLSQPGAAPFEKHTGDRRIIFGHARHRAKEAARVEEASSIGFAGRPLHLRESV